MSQPIDIAINRMYPGEKLLYKDARWGKFTHSFHEQSLTVDELIEEVIQGYSFCPVMKDSHHKLENFVSAQHTGLDDDRGTSASLIDLLVEDPFTADHAGFLYETISSTQEYPKSRVFFVLDEPIYDRARYRLAQEALWWKFSATAPHV